MLIRLGLVLTLAVLFHISRSDPCWAEDREWTFSKGEDYSYDKELISIDGVAGLKELYASWESESDLKGKGSNLGRGFGYKIVNNRLETGEEEKKAISSNDKGLVGLWHLDDDFYDATSFASHGTAYNITLTSGKIDKSAKLSGKNSYVDLGRRSVLELGDNFTVTAWINPSELRAYSVVVAKVSAQREKSKDYYRFVCHSDGRLGLFGHGYLGKELYCSRSSGSWRYRRYSLRDKYGDIGGFSHPTNIKPGKWYHIAWVAKDEYAYFYVNGFPYGRQKLYWIDYNMHSFKYIDNPEHHVFLGSYSTDSKSDFNGYIDEVAMYSRSLGEEEIYAQYLNGAPKKDFSFYTSPRLDLSRKTKVAKAKIDRDYSLDTTSLEVYLRAGDSHFVDTEIIPEKNLADTTTADFNQGLRKQGVEAVSGELRASEEVVKQIAAGGNFSLFLSSTGKIKSCGHNNYYQLGNGHERTTTTPLPVLNIDNLGDNIQQIACGANHSLALLEDRETIYAWGYDQYGQLGFGSCGNTTAIPAKIYLLKKIGKTSKIKAISVGNEHSLVLLEDGTIYAWGYNKYGQCGESVKLFCVNPVLVAGISNVVAISAGGYHSLALTANGEVYAWGYNDHGQVGDGKPADRANPVKVLTNAKAIYAGGYHSLAIKTNNEVYAWGYNGNGQLGDGTGITKSLPIKVKNLTNAKAISAGGYHSLALTANGEVYAWGYNSHGQLGDETNAAKSSPVKVLTNAKAISAGGYHSLAIKTNNEVYAWGYNYYCQLGDGTGTNRNTPVEVKNTTPSMADKSIFESRVWDLGKDCKGRQGDLLVFRTDGLSKTEKLSFRLRAGEMLKDGLPSPGMRKGIVSWSSPIPLTVLGNSKLNVITIPQKEELKGRYWQYRLEGETAGKGEQYWAVKDVLFIPQAKDYSRLKEILSGEANIKSGESKRYYQWLVLGASNGYDSFKLDKVNLTYYANTNQAIVNKQGAYYGNLDDFTAELGLGNEGKVSYQISPDGEVWYYFSEGDNRWQQGEDYFESSSLSLIKNKCKSFSFQVRPGNFYFKAFLRSDGSEKVELNSIKLSYEKLNLTLSAPRPGEVLTAGEKYKIKWSQEGKLDDADYKLELCLNGLDNEKKWKQLVSGDDFYIQEGDGSLSWNWIVPEVTTQQALVRVSYSNFPAIKDRCDNVFTIAGGLELVTPKEKDIWAAGYPHNIIWKTTGGISKVNLLYSVGGRKYQPINTQALEDKNKYSWDVPLEAVGKDVKIKVVSDSNKDTFSESASFTIERIEVTSPRDGQRLQAGTSQEIKWKAEGTGKVRIEYSYDDFKKAYLIGETSLEKRSLAWDIPEEAVTSSEVKIRVKANHEDAQGFYAFGVSSRFIICGELKVIGPNGAEELIAGEPYNITWQTVKGKIGYVDIAYSQGGDYQIIKERVENTGRYQWEPNKTGNDFKIVVSDSNDPVTRDSSDSYFTVSGINIVSPSEGDEWEVAKSSMIRWSSTGVTIDNVNISYNNGKGWKYLAKGYSNIGSFQWLEGPGLGDITSRAYIQITDSGSSGMRVRSGKFTIRGAIKVTAPQEGAVWDVGSSQKIEWETKGEISRVNLAYSKDAGKTWIDIPQAQALKISSKENKHSFLWEGIPSAISRQVKIKVSDDVGGHPLTFGVSDEFTIQPQFTILSPTAQSNWGVDGSYEIKWQNPGGINKVKLEYLPPQGDPRWDWETIALVDNGKDGLGGSYLWKVPDLVSEYGSPQDKEERSLPIKIRVIDITSGNIATSKVSEEFKVAWFRIIFNVKNAATGNPLVGLDVDCSSGWSDIELASGVDTIHHYKYGNYNTTFSYTQKDETKSAGVTGWLADRDKVINIFVEDAEQLTIPYSVNSDFVYNKEKDEMLIGAWIEKRGVLMTNSLGLCTVEVYDNNQLIKSLTDEAPDNQGMYSLVWDTAGVEGNKI